VYAGALVMLFGTPLALGSFWGLLMFAAMACIIVLRLLDEERFLAKHLSGYGQYRRSVRYRLIPFVF
jgi:protein-S-isoprenylcysteine O-methyltransferase Ste14